MRTIQKIIAERGAMDEWAGGHVRIVNDPYMPLLIEWLGEGPQGGDLVSVSHTYEQHGDAMRDPEIVFLVTEDDWIPVSFRNDSTGAYRESMIVEGGEIRYVRPELTQELREFSQVWDRNLAAQGYLEVITGS